MHKKKQNIQHRYDSLDLIRTLAIVLMVIFHFCYDLRYFGYVEWNVPNGHGWWQFRYLILSLFIGTLGASFYLAHGARIRWRGFWKRQLQLMAAAAAITVMSLFMFPEAWIYFGILHFLAFASFCLLLVVGRPLVATILGLLLLVLSLTVNPNPYWPFVFISAVLPTYTEDFVPILPWLSVALLGYGAGYLLATQKGREMDAFFGQKISKLSLKPLVSVGRHGLVIYLLHQPVLFALFYLYALVHK